MMTLFYIWLFITIIFSFVGQGVTVYCITRWAFPTLFLSDRSYQTEIGLLKERYDELSSQFDLLQAEKNTLLTKIFELLKE